MGLGSRFAAGKIVASSPVAAAMHDIVRPRQLHAVFLLSPHAHAEVLAIDMADTLASPGVAAIFTAEDVTADKLNGVPCAWGIVGKGGAPMREPPHPLGCPGARCGMSATRWR
jgi:CO/xanthine dehydrogenase Mo-binding subunit